MNPCIDYCLYRFRREYSEDCDNFCAYAQAERRCAELQAKLERVKSERDAAIRDIERVMFCGGGNIDTCNYCMTEDCYARGGHRLCDPKWNGKTKEEVFES